MWSLTTLTGLFYSLNQHYIAPASRPRSRAEEPVEPVPPERGPGRGAGGAGGAGAAGERAGAAGPPEQAGAGRSRPRSRAEEPVEPVEPGRGAGGAGGAGAAGERAGAAGPPEQAGAGRCRRSRPGGPGSRAAGRLQKKKKKKRFDKRFNCLYIRRRRKGERPSRDTAANLCHKVWLFFDNLIKRRLCYGT